VKRLLDIHSHDPRDDFRISILAGRARGTHDALANRTALTLRPANMSELFDSPARFEGAQITVAIDERRWHLFA
jgi:hypothetical protein